MHQQGGVVKWVLFGLASLAVLGCGKEKPLETVPEKALGQPVVGSAESDGESPAAERTPPSESQPHVGDAEVVSSYALEGKRISGETRIVPSERVKKEMVLSQLDELSPVVEMCLDEDGAVKSLELVRTSGFREYDEQILGAMSRWKYEPHAVAGEPRSVCTHIRFVYHQKQEQEEQRREAIGQVEPR